MSSSWLCNERDGDKRMCLSGPKIITTAASAAVPERQASKSPYGSSILDAGAAAQDALRRRMGLASTILTSPLGLTTPAYTAGKTLLGS